MSITKLPQRSSPSGNATKTNPARCISFIDTPSLCGVRMRSSLFDLTDKVAIVTGSSRGLGYASALGMAEHGAKVVISGRNAEACETAAHAINEKIGSRAAMPFACNIGRKAELKNLVDAANGEWGSVDIVMANAAIHPWIGSV